MSICQSRVCTKCEKVRLCLVTVFIFYFQKLAFRNIKKKQFSYMKMKVTHFLKKSVLRMPLGHWLIIHFKKKKIMEKEKKN